MSKHVDVSKLQAAPDCTPRNGEPYFDLDNLPHDNSKKPYDLRKKRLDNILELIGVTPMVKLNKIPQSEGIQCDMYVKLEYENPGGSIKDRIAYRMVVEAEKENKIKPGVTTLIEPTSGNTGIGIALMAAIKGYKCIIVMPDKTSTEKVDTVLALGAQVVMTPDVGHDDPDNDVQVAKRLQEETPNSFILNQFDNQYNPMAHYDGTAEEILWSMDGNVDMIVMGAGTSGTISGTSYRIKKKCPDCIIIGVDPYGSLLARPPDMNDTTITYYEVEGIGYDFCPDVLDYDVIDRWVKTKDYDSFNMARRLIREEGILCGGSAGAAMWTALQAAKNLKKGQKCVVVLPDGIRNYMSKFVSDPWMEVRNFKRTPHNKHCKTWWYDKLKPEMVHVIPKVKYTATTRDAMQHLEKGEQVCAVVDEHESVVGMLPAKETLYRLEHQYTLDDPLKRFVVKHFVKLYMSDKPTLGSVARALKAGPYIPILEKNKVDSKVLGIMTAAKLLEIVTKLSE